MLLCLCLCQQLQPLAQHQSSRGAPENVDPKLQPPLHKGLVALAYTSITTGSALGGESVELQPTRTSLACHPIACLG